MFKEYVDIAERLKILHKKHGLDYPEITVSREACAKISKKLSDKLFSDNAVVGSKTFYLGAIKFHVKQ